MREDIVAAARGWIGTPYRHQASLKGVGCDCLGLLRGVWRELHGDEPEAAPPYASDWNEGAADGDHMRAAFARHMDKIPVGDITPGDAAVFRMAPGAPAKHCGIIAGAAGRLTLIHACQGRAVREEAFTRFWQVRLANAFRL